MSYLSLPRLIFAGQFRADPLTINNDPEHFDSADFQSNYQVPGPGATNGWWNPKGTGAWGFRGCTVQRVIYRDGSSSDDPNVDPIVGAAVNGADRSVEGKLVQPRSRAANGVGDLGVPGAGWPAQPWLRFPERFRGGRIRRHLGSLSPGTTRLVLRDVLPERVGAWREGVGRRGRIAVPSGAFCRRGAEAVERPVQRRWV